MGIYAPKRECTTRSHCALNYSVQRSVSKRQLTSERLEVSLLPQLPAAIGEKVLTLTSVLLVFVGVESGPHDHFLITHLQTKNRRLLTVIMKQNCQARTHQSPPYQLSISRSARLYRRHTFWRCDSAFVNIQAGDSIAPSRTNHHLNENVTWRNFFKKEITKGTACNFVDLRNRGTCELSTYNKV